MTDKESWKTRLTQARERAGIKKSRLAAMLDVNPASITDWEGDKVKMLDGETLVRIAEILHVTPEWIINGQDGGDQESTAVTQEFSWLYRRINDEGKAFMRNTLAVVKATYSNDASPVRIRSVSEKNHMAKHQVISENMTDKESWKTRLTQARERAGIKKSRLAAMLGVNPSSITTWEGEGVKMLDGEMLVRIAEILHVTPEWIINGQNGGGQES